MSARFLRKKQKPKSAREEYYAHRDRHIQATKQLFESSMEEIQNSILVTALLTATYNTGRDRTEKACKREAQFLKRKKQVQEEKKAADTYELLHEKDFEKDNKLAGIKKEVVDASKF